jgi:IS30 family transposase
MTIICKWQLGLVERASRLVINNADIAVYFCDPHSQLQIGSNENMYWVVRPYPPK